MLADNNEVALAIFKVLQTLSTPYFWGLIVRNIYGFKEKEVAIFFMEFVT